MILPRKSPLLSLITLLAIGSSLRCSEEPPVPLVLQSSDLTLSVTGRSGVISDEQALKALEDASRQLRRRMDAAGRMSTGHVHALPCPDVLLDASGTDHKNGALSHESATHDDWQFTILPRTLLWEPLLANPSEPRFYVKPSTLRTPELEETIDTAVGGQIGFYRFSPANAPDQGLQIDVFAVVLSRWTNRKYEVNSDFRYGIPLTFAWGNMHGKIGYEHTSSHLGDDAIERTGRQKIRNVHDDLVLGLDYRFFNTLRVYGVYAYPLTAKTPVDGRPQRFDWGVEWSRRETTSIYGQPFAAFDMVLREEQDYTPNTTTQIGWQWLDMESGHSLRLALEHFNGKSTLGQYFLENEHWLAIGAYLDF